MEIIDIFNMIIKLLEKGFIIKEKKCPNCKGWGIYYVQYPNGEVKEVQCKECCIGDKFTLEKKRNLDLSDKK